MELSMSQTYFNHPVEERYTWFSPDGNTRKVLDYILVNNFVRDYISECKVWQSDIESDHRMLVASIRSPKTKKARWKIKQKRVVSQKLDENALKNEATRQRFIDSVKKTIRDIKEEDCNNRNEIVLKSLTDAAQATLPNQRKQVKETKETWKEDADLNTLLRQRNFINLIQKVDQTYKKTCASTSQRKNTQMEANIINDHANRKEVEQLFRTFKSDNSSFKKERPRTKCDPADLKAYFEKHFTSPQIEHTPIELDDVPEFTLKLKLLSTQNLNILPPEEKEIIDIIKNLKERKSANEIPIAFIKCAIDNKDFVSEIVKLYQSVWETNTIPKN